jgi:hypothetical protein
LIAALLLPFDVAARRVAIPIGTLIAQLVGAIRRRRLPVAVATPARIERLQNAKERAHVKAAPEEEAAWPPAAVAPTEPTSAASRLLDAKKRRDESSE